MSLSEMLSIVEYPSGRMGMQEQDIEVALQKQNEGANPFTPSS